jgi:ankyrin repeat protein
VLTHYAKIPWKAQTKKDSETALHLAIQAGHTATAIALIHHKDANVSVKDGDSQTPLHHAARTNNLEVATALLAKGAKLDDVNDFGWTPMLIAAAYGHTILMADLITRGENTEVKLGWPNFKPAKKTHEVRICP